MWFCETTLSLSLSLPLSLPLSLSPSLPPSLPPSIIALCFTFFCLVNHREELGVFPFTVFISAGQLTPTDLRVGQRDVIMSRSHGWLWQCTEDLADCGTNGPHEGAPRRSKDAMQATSQGEPPILWAGDSKSVVLV